MSKKMYLTVSEVAALAGVAPETVYAWIREGRLPGVHKHRAEGSPHNRYHVLRAEAETFVAERQPSPPRRPRTRPPRPARDKLDPVSVLEIRHRMAAGADAGRLAAEYGVTPETIQAVWHGKIWRSVGGPTGTPEPIRQLSDEQVRRIREAYANDGRTRQELAQEYGVHVSWVSAVLRGATRRGAGGPLVRRERPRPSDAQVRRIREAHAAGKTQVELAREYGVSQSWISLIVRGDRYSEAGGPTARREDTRLTDAQVRQIRQAYANGKNRAELAAEYGISVSLVSALVNGDRRQEAGGPITKSRYVLRRKTAATEPRS